MVNGTSTPLLFAMQEKLLLKHQVADVANILGFHCPVMSLGSGSNDYLIFLHTSLVRPRTNEAVLWVGEVTAEEEQRASEKRGRERDFKSRTDGMSCKDSKQLRKQRWGVLYKKSQNREGIVPAGTRQDPEVTDLCFGQGLLLSD